MNRTQIIQLLIDKLKAKNYLEIGMGPGVNFSNIRCENKISVDPTPTVPVTFTLTSDDFFKQNNKKFDVIFIDGLHWCGQVYKDIINSLSVLNEHGFIICHDMNPHTELMQRYPIPDGVPGFTGEWTGDCWKAWIKLKTERNDLNMRVVDTDYGCGIISRGSQEILETLPIQTDPYNLTYDIFHLNKKKLLNLITVEEFVNSI